MFFWFLIIIFIIMFIVYIIAPIMYTVYSYVMWWRPAVPFLGRDSFVVSPAWIRRYQCEPPPPPPGPRQVGEILLPSPHTRVSREAAAVGRARSVSPAPAVRRRTGRSLLVV